MSFFSTTLFSIGIAFSVAAWAQESAPTGSVAKGQKVFIELACNSCHGTQGQGGERGAGPKLAPNPFPWPAFLQQLRKPRRDMPAYIEPWVSDQDVADLYAYVRSIKPAPAAKDLPLLKNF